MSSVLTPKVFILDVDGVLTDGKFYYSTEGKALKAFGPDDNDALSLVRAHLEIRFISGDKRGFPISQRRIVEDMGYPLDLVGPTGRVEWIAERYPLEQVVFMGDGIFDHFVMSKVGYGIAPKNGDPYTKKCAHYVTERCGGDRAVSEACMHLLGKFFGAYDPCIKADR